MHDCSMKFMQIALAQLLYKLFPDSAYSCVLEGVSKSRNNCTGILTMCIRKIPVMDALRARKCQCGVSAIKINYGRRSVQA